MRNSTLIITFVATLLALVPAGANAQQAVSTPTKPSPPQASVTALPQVPQECLRALDGTCTNPAMVDAAGKRAEIMSSVRVSYFGTPAGTVGGSYIPYERFFRDNEVVFGLPTYQCTGCNVVRRTK